MKRIFCLLTVLVLLLCAAGCHAAGGPAAPEESTRTTVDVYLTNGYRYAPIRVLTDNTLRAELEARTGVTVELHYRDAGRESTMIDAERMNGIILTDDLIAMQDLIENTRVAPLAFIPGTMTQSSYGRYRGYQYGYVFNEGECSDAPVLLVAVDKLEQAGIENVPFNADSVEKMLRTLKETCKEPMAVYGDPTDASYVTLLSLFRLAPRGGYELGPDGYDKLSVSAKEYLSFIRKLHADGLIPSSMLSLNEYSAGTKMISGGSALVVIYEPEYLGAFLDYAGTQGIRLARAELPVPEEYLLCSANDRLLGLITSNCKDTEQATRLLEELDIMAAALETADPLAGLETYPLFTKRGATPADAGPAAMEPNVFYLSAKQQIDEQFISVIYSQIATGERPLDAFDTMCEQWKSTSVNMMNASVTGGEILFYYANQYRTAAK